MINKLTIPKKQYVTNESGNRISHPAGHQNFSAVKMVYELYGLTEDEVRVVEGSG